MTKKTTISNNQADILRILFISFWCEWSFSSNIYSSPLNPLCGYENYTLNAVLLKKNLPCAYNGVW